MLATLTLLLQLSQNTGPAVQPGWSPSQNPFNKTHSVPVAAPDRMQQFMASSRDEQTIKAMGGSLARLEEWPFRGPGAGAFLTAQARLVKVRPCLNGIALTGPGSRVRHVCQRTCTKDRSLPGPGAVPLRTTQARLVMVQPQSDG